MLGFRPFVCRRNRFWRNGLCRRLRRDSWLANWEDDLLRGFGFGSWAGRKPELAVFNNDSNQCAQKDAQGNQHSTALLLFENRVRRDAADFWVAILLQHRHLANSLPLPNSGLAA